MTKSRKLILFVGRFVVTRDLTSFGGYDPTNRYSKCCCSMRKTRGQIPTPFAMHAN